MHSRPVFADPSGRRRRAMRRIGFVSAAALAICLGAMVMAMAGGPTAPFAEWAAPRAPAATAHDGSADRDPAHSTASPSPSGPPPPSPSARSAPAPSGNATPRATASDTAAASSNSGSPLPTNPAGRTPPGHTKSPHPRTPHGL
ncbi:MAG TPA: hypothetical protein VHS30_35290 [Streptosporangiaceae bacterium]|nr:hypothetical protein [Streptosporangiaceae bacterium]